MQPHETGAFRLPVIVGNAGNGGNKTFSPTLIDWESKHYNDSEEPKQYPYPMADSPDTEVRWYAMSAPYRRELRARDIFANEGIDCFVPLRQVLVEKPGGRRVRELRPAVASLIFVRATRNEVQRVKDCYGIMQYITRPEGGRNVPVTVPVRQMDSFRRAVELSLHNYLYFRPGEIDISRGRRVRIIGGPLNGVEGIFMKVKGGRSRRLVVMLDSIGAVAAEVEPDFVQLLDERGGTSRCAAPRSTPLP